MANAPVSALWRAARPLQWQKNLLLLAAAVFSVDQHWDAGSLEDWRRVLLRGLLGVAVFSVASSAVYLANDARDAESDRAHPKKRERPIATGALAAAEATRWALVLALVALVAGYLLAPAFAAVVLVYLALSALYTRFLRRVPVVEACAIAAGFGLRAIAGAAAIDVPASGWLVSLATLGALFVVWLKREQEQALLGDLAGAHRSVHRRYRPPFLQVAVGFTGWWIGGIFAAYAVRPGAPGGGLLLLALVPVTLGLWRFATLARRAGARPVDELVMRDAPLLGAVVAFLAVSFAVLASGR